MATVSETERQRSDEGRTIAASGALLLGAFLLTKAAGYIQKVIIAHKFGTGADMDVYVLSFTIPDILLFLVIGGAVSSAFVPVTSERLARGDDEGARSVVNGVMTAAFLILLGAVLLLEAAAPWSSAGSPPTSLRGARTWP